MTDRRAEAAAGARASARRLAAFAVAATVALFALQMVAAARLELTFDEAYYALWSRHLAWGYLDHPPMVAAFIRASTDLFGSSEWGVRALTAFSSGAMSPLVALIAWRLFGSGETAALAALTWAAMPLVAAAALATPDTPLVVFWTLGLAALVELWRSGRARWLLALGVALGLALMSKFTAAFLAAGALLAFAATPSLRRWLTAPALVAAGLIAAAIVAPFVAWNAEHGWATFVKQLGRAPPHGFAPGYLLEFLGAEIGLMNPLVFPAFVAALAAVGWRGAPAAESPEEARRLLTATILPAIAYFAFHALHDRVQGNWLAPLYPAAAILAADWLVQARRAGAPGLARLVAGAARFAAPLGLGVAALALMQALTGLLPLGAADPTARVGGFRDLARDLDDVARRDKAAFVVTRGYGLTALMTVYGDPALPAVQRDERLRWVFAPSPPELLFAAPGLAIGEAGRGFEADLRGVFGAVEPAATLERRRGGVDLGGYDVYRVSRPIAPVLAPACARC